MDHFMSLDSYKEFKKSVKAATGFTCYENQPGDQPAWYGTNSKFEEFKTMVANKIDTGTVVLVLDTGKRYVYSDYTGEWYEN